MRKLTKRALSLLCIGTVVFGSACGGKNKDYGAYEDVANKAADATFTFETNLAEESYYPLSTGGEVYYVAADGKSSNSGLSESDPINLAKVSSLDLGAGDSVLFKKGDTFEGTVTINNKSGADDNPITFASYGKSDKKPHIHNRVGDVITFSKCSNIVLRDLEVSMDGIGFDVQLNPAYNCINFQYSYVGKEKFKNIYVVNNDVHGGGTETSVMGISISSLEKTAATSPKFMLENVYITNNHVHDLGRSGIHASGWLAEEVGNQNNAMMDLYRNIYMNNNDVHDIGNIGLYIAACTNSTINRNLVYRTGMRTHSQEAEGDCGIMALGADTMDIMYNVCYDNRRAGTTYDAMAIDIDWNTTNINVQYNHCYENDGSGIGTMACQNSYIRNNRVENNRCITNQVAQIQVSNFTSRYACVDDDMHSVRNVIVEENLIVGTPSGKKMFKAQDFNGDTDWTGNVFQNNHVIYTGDSVKTIYWVEVDSTVSWYKFASNKYYSKDTSDFRCFDYTSIMDINYEEGAQPYQFTPKFESWLKRDLNSTYEELSNSAPSAPKNGNITFANGELNISWAASKGDLWHYNVHLVKEGEAVSYLNMLGETTSTAYSFAPEFKGTYYVVIQPESNQGVYGKAIKLKVVLN